MKDSPINENLYSRQLYVLGSDAMTAFQQSSVLIIGLTGLGQEVAKNTILAGIHKVILFDSRPVVPSDFSSGFFFQTLGKRRDEDILKKMKELNPYVDVSILDYDQFVINENFINFIKENHNFTTIVTCGLPYYNQVLFKDLNSYFISCQVNGLFSQVFCDFKDNFLIKDANGEPCITGTINDLTEDGVLTVIEGERHGLEKDMIIKVYKDSIDLGDYKVEKIISAFKVQINYNGEFFQGGSFEEIKQEKVLNFKNITEATDILDLGDEKKAQLIHNCYMLYNDKFNIEYYKQNINKLKYQVICEEIINAFVLMKDIEIIPMVSIIGGFVSQEILKSCSGKFTPLHQFMYFDSLDILNISKTNKNNNANDNKPEEIKKQEVIDETTVEVLHFVYLKGYNTHEADINSRYYSYIKLFGNDNFKKFKDSSIFVVGAGAIGCEHLKNIALSGLSLNSTIYLTDMDSIEQSNLNRQFLFRQNDVGKMKSDIAIREIKKMNPDYKNIISYTLKVGSDTENIFSDTFYKNLTLVANALDNIEARNYVDSRIILNCIPLFESGTLGTKGNTQVIIPYKTESYSSSADPPEKSIPMCTLRNFPHLIEHTIEFALSEFKNSFCDKIVSINDYISKEEHESIKKENIDEDICDMIVNIPYSVDDCIKCAFDLFYKLFYVNIKKLLNTFPEDHITNEGIPFWSAPKRAPTAVEFSKDNENHIIFIISSVFLYMECFGIDGDVTEKMIVEYFNQFKDKIKERANEKINLKIGEKSDEKDKKISDEKSNTDSMPTFSLADSIPFALKDKLKALDFEKDDDSNHHVDFIFTCANIRAENYKIKEATRLQVKGIAGRIIPAIATTTAIVSGLSVLEMYKYILGCDFSVFKNTYLNLALPLLASSEPLEAMKYKYYFKPNETHEFTLWDRFEFNDMTMKEFLEIIKTKFNTEVNMISCNNVIIWDDFMNKEKHLKKIDMKFSEIVKPIAGRKFLVLDCLFEGECEIFPFVIINL